MHRKASDFTEALSRLFMDQCDNERWAHLMRMAQSGDENAYASLLTELAAYITRFLRRQFGSFAFVDDCVQEVLLAVHTAKHTYHPEKPFKPWLHALIKFKTIDLIRKNQRHQQGVDIDSDWEEKSIENRTERDIEDYLSGAQLISQLDKPNRDALIYTKLIGLSVEDTATKLNTSPSAIKQRVKRAIAKTSRIMAASLQ